MALSPVTRPPDAQVQQLAKLAEVYDAWMAEVLPEVPFHPKEQPADTVYNQHFPDVESSGDMEDLLARMVAEAGVIPPPDSPGSGGTVRA